MKFCKNCKHYVVIDERTHYCMSPSPVLQGDPSVIIVPFGSLVLLSPDKIDLYGADCEYHEERLDKWNM
ncbi:MAG: hypothetical protein KAJ03_10250 [Gammaproteobacteria bacterium]|nr:hypothetical protein [Gammaproteobacteria bacterium]